MAPKIKILQNGLRYLILPRSSVRTVAMVVFVKTGVEYETKRINGVSHLLEHMLFKGTDKRPHPRLVSEELDAIGATSNAYTGREITAYWGKSTKDKFQKMFELLADIYMNSRLDAGELEKEKGVVIEEINMCEDTPVRRVHDLYAELLFGNQPAGWDIAGSKESVRRISREDISSYRDKHYVAPNTVVAIAGGISKSKAETLIKKYFNSLSKRSGGARKSVKVRQLKPKCLLKYKASDQDHLILGVRTWSMFDKRRYILEVIGEILAGGSSSRLYHRLRNELGAAYYIHSNVDLGIDYGTLSVSCGADHKKTRVVLKSILREYEDLSSVPVSDRELSRAKNHLIGEMMTGLETPLDEAEYFGMSELLRKRIISPEETMRKIREVTAKDILQVAKEIFIARHLNLAVIGPYRNEKQLLSLLKIK